MDKNNKKQTADNKNYNRTEFADEMNSKDTQGKTTQAKNTKQNNK